MRIYGSSSVMYECFEDEICFRDALSEIGLVKSVNLPTMKIKLCHKISFKLWNLSSSQEKHTCHDTKVIKFL